MEDGMRKYNIYLIPKVENRENRTLKKNFKVMAEFLHK